MKVDAETEVAVTNNVRTSAARIWLSEELSQQMEPLLSGLGIELLAAHDRKHATIRIESLAGPDSASSFSGGLRIERGEDGAEGAIEFEGPNVWAAASCIVSQAFGLFPPLLTADVKMFAVIRAAARAAQVGSPILVTGETGTGKELLVRLIHAASGRAGRMFSINCAALNDTTVADAFDGAGRGSAVGEHRLEELCAASDITLFLDQVSELSPVAQTRVLYAILRGVEAAAGTMRPAAGLVLATNRPLGPLVLSGEFRRDLYDRLAVLIIGMPPLRDRRADVALLAVNFLRIAAPQLSFTPGALKALSNYPFPGNVRELHNLVTRLAIMPPDGVSRLIDTADVRAQFVVPVLSASVWKSSPFQMRREMVMQALMICGGDRTAAARKLGISLRALQQHVVVGSGSSPPRAR
jgi:DNA-binding NtrC family response regulator